MPIHCLLFTFLKTDHLADGPFFEYESETHGKVTFVHRWGASCDRHGCGLSNIIRTSPVHYQYGEHAVLIRGLPNDSILPALTTTITQPVFAYEADDHGNNRLVKSHTDIKISCDWRQIFTDFYAEEKYRAEFTRELAGRTKRKLRYYLHDFVRFNDLEANGDLEKATSTLELLRIMGRREARDVRRQRQRHFFERNGYPDDYDGYLSDAQEQLVDVNKNQEDRVKLTLDRSRMVYFVTESEGKSGEDLFANLES